MIETIHLRVEDESERNYYRTVWFLAGALRAIGAADQVIPTLQEVFNRTLAEGPPPRNPKVALTEHPGVFSPP